MYVLLGLIHTNCAHIDCNLSWKDHVNSVCSRIQQRLCFLKRLRVFGVGQKIVRLFYTAVIESILRYGISVWYGNLNASPKAQVNRLVCTAMKVMGEQARRIIIDPCHVLYSEYDLLL